MVIFVILIMGAIGFIGTDVYLPSLPFIVEALDTTKGNVQLTLSAYLFSFGTGQIYFGPLSEKWGRKKVALTGLIILWIGSFICAFSPNIGTLILGRLIEGMGVAGPAAVMRAILRDVYSGDELSQKGSYISVGTAFCMAAAPALGGYIQRYLGWRFSFGFIILYTLIAFLIAFFLLPETHKHLNPEATKPKILLKKYWHLLTRPIFLGYAGCSMFTFGGLSAYLTVAPFLFQEVVGLTPVEFGWMAIFVALGLGGGGAANSFFIYKAGRHRMLKIGTILQILSGVLMLLPALIGKIDVILVMIPMLVFMLGSALVYTNSFAGAFHFFGHMGGFVGAIYGCLQIVGGTIFAAIMAFLHAKTQLPLAIILLIVGFLNLLLQKLGHHFTLKCESQNKQ